MAFRFGRQSEYWLRTIHPDLRRVVRRALTLSPIDITVVDGHRDEARQAAYFARGRSKVEWPDSRHNQYPSQAIDIAPWVNGGIPWDDHRYFYILGGVVLAASKLEAVPIRWGGDWNSDGDLSDQDFHDLGHFELS